MKILVGWLNFLVRVIVTGLVLSGFVHFHILLIAFFGLRINDAVDRCCSADNTGCSVVRTHCSFLDGEIGWYSGNFSPIFIKANTCYRLHAIEREWLLQLLFLWFFNNRFLLLQLVVFIGRVIQRFLDDLPHLLLILHLIVLEDSACDAIGRGKSIGVCKQRSNGRENGPDIVDGTPLVLQH